MARIPYEVCVESAEDACVAAQAGAARVELCAGLLEGGTTPSLGAMLAARAAVVVPVTALIRPRPGDFVYSRAELAVIERDVEAAREAGVAGVALGLVDGEGAVPRVALERLVARARPLEVTFHRAFDQARDARATLELLVELGVARVLTSGGAAEAAAGTAGLRERVELAAGRLCIVAAGGVRPANVARLVRESGVPQVHGSASPGGGPLGFRGRRGTDPEAVRALVRALEALERD